MAAFAVASANVGVTAPITVSVDTGAETLPATATICQSNPSSGQCLATPAASVSLDFAAGSAPTFSVFLQSTGGHRLRAGFIEDFRPLQRCRRRAAWFDQRRDRDSVVRLPGIWPKALKVARRSDQGRRLPETRQHLADRPDFSGESREPLQLFF